MIYLLGPTIVHLKSLSNYTMHYFAKRQKEQSPSKMSVIDSQFRFLHMLLKSNTIIILMYYPILVSHNKCKFYSTPIFQKFTHCMRFSILRLALMFGTVYRPLMHAKISFIIYYIFAFFQYDFNVHFRCTARIRYTFPTPTHNGL